MYKYCKIYIYIYRSEEKHKIYDKSIIIILFDKLSEATCTPWSRLTSKTYYKEYRLNVKKNYNFTHQ